MSTPRVTANTAVPWVGSRPTPSMPQLTAPSARETKCRSLPNCGYGLEKPPRRWARARGWSVVASARVRGNRRSCRNGHFAQRVFRTPHANHTRSRSSRNARSSKLNATSTVKLWSISYPLVTSVKVSPLRVQGRTNPVLPVLQFVFASFWHYTGCLMFVLLPAACLGDGLAARRRKP